jgi:predicted CXXCH cytochrome family protein
MNPGKSAAAIGAAVLLFAGAALLPAGSVPARTPFHTNSAHLRAPRQCSVCHVGHRASSQEMLKVRLWESVCGGCHGAADFARWRLEDQQANVPSGPPPTLPLSTFQGGTPFRVPLRPPGAVR